MPALLLVDPKKTQTATEASPQPAPQPLLAAVRQANRVRDEVSFLAQLDAAPQDGAPSVEGRWFRGTESYNTNLTVWLHFYANGSAHYGNSQERATITVTEWRQQGSQVYLALNNRYSEWLLTLEGDRLTGQAQNCTGFQWKLDFTRQD